MNRKSTVWDVDYYDANGKRRWKTCKTYGEAIEVRAFVERQRRHGVSDDGVTFGEYARQWLDVHGRKVRPSTKSTYELMLRRHLLPYLGNTRLAHIRRYMLKEMVIKLDASLSLRSIRLVIKVLSAILESAIEDELIEANPSRRLHRVIQPKRVTEDILAFTSEELSRLLEAARVNAPAFYPFVLTLARTGMRTGEAEALQWKHVEFDAAEIRIEQTFDRKYRIQKPKGGRSRAIEMSPMLEAVLRELRATRFHVEPVDGERFVFHETLGRWNAARIFSRVLKAAGLPTHHSPKSLRHTVATLLLESGAMPQEVQKLLGHHSIKLTVDVYGRWMKFRKGRRIADQLDEKPAQEET